MSFLSSWSRKAPSIDDSASLGLSESKRAAWAFAIGERRPSTDPPRGRRLSRADLPDVDFSRAVPVAQPSGLQRLIAWLGLMPQPAIPVSDEWRVLRSSSAAVSDRDLPARHDNVININRAA